MNEPFESVTPCDLVRIDSDVLSDTARVHTVGSIERSFLERFPAADACSWDRTGVLVGNRCAVVEKVAVALDPTVNAVRLARECGCSLLMTHHPVFLDAPEDFTVDSASPSGRVVAEAIRADVSIMSFHTALDVSRPGLLAVPDLLRLTPESPLEELPHDATKGFGCICTSDEKLDLSHLAARCTAVFERLPRVWGAPNKPLSRIVTYGGSASDACAQCIEAGIDCLICGEVKYHAALDAAAEGLCIIDLGHDVSELPLVGVLARELLAFGFSPQDVIVLDQSNNWVTPEALRR